MTDTTIFNGETAPVVPTQSNEPTLQIPTEVQELVGEGKKYKSVEEALKSVPHAQNHIQKLEDEAKILKEELAKRKTTEELLEELKGGFKQESGQPPTPGITSQDIEKTVAAVLAKKEAFAKAENNTSKVVSTFVEIYGDQVKAEEMYKKVAQDAGLSVQGLNQLAATAPEAVFKLAGITKKQEQQPGKTQSTVNTQNFQQGNTTGLSAKVSMVGASSKDIAAAWRAAGELVKQKMQG